MRFIVFNLPRDLARPLDYMVMWLYGYGWDHLMESHTPTKFGGDMHSGSEDMMVSLC